MQLLVLDEIEIQIFEHNNQINYKKRIIELNQSFFTDSIDLIWVNEIQNMLFMGSLNLNLSDLKI